MEKNNKQIFGKQYFESDGKVAGLNTIPDNSDTRTNTIQEHSFVSVKNQENQNLVQKENPQKGNQNIYQKKQILG